MAVPLITSGSPTLNGDSTCTIDDTGNDRVATPGAPKLLNETQGWAAARVKMAWASTGALPGGSLTPAMFFWGDGSFASRILSYWGTANSATAARQDAVPSGPTVSQTGVWALNDLVTLIAKWTVGDIGISLNGQNFTLSSPVNTIKPALVSPIVDIGNFNNQVNRTCVSPMLWFACGTGVLTNADVSLLSTNEITWRTLDRDRQMTFRWTCDTFEGETYPFVVEPNTPSVLPGT